jgi:hypothetical protein
VIRCRVRWPAWIRPSKRFATGTGLRARYRQKRRGGPLELVDRYHATAEALEGCGRVLGACRSSATGGDHAL